MHVTVPPSHIKSVLWIFPLQLSVSELRLGANLRFQNRSNPCGSSDEVEVLAERR